MAYNIFIDTSIFKDQCFDVENRQFQSLERLRQSGLINLFITDVVKAEVENRIKFEVEDGAKLVKKKARTLWTYFNTKKEDITQDLLNKFNNYIKKNFTLIEVPENGIGKRIIYNYLNNKPPFDTSKEDKKHEFPDAFIIEAIAEYLEERNWKGIFLSGDHDCISFINNNERLDYEEKIGTLLNRLNTKNDECTAKISQAMNNQNSNLVSVLNAFLESLDIDHYGYDTDELSQNSFFDFDISSVDYIEDSLEFSRTDYYIYDIDSETEYVQLAISVQYQVNAVLNADDYSNASYDKEDDRYYFVENIEIDNRFQVEEVEIVVGLNIETGEFEVISEPDEINTEFNIDEPLDADE